MKIKQFSLLLGIFVSIFCVVQTATPCGVGIANALPFCTTVDFADFTLPWSDRTVALLIDSPFIQNVPYEYAFELDLDPAGVALNSASLSLTHWGNNSLFGPKIWLATSEGGIEIGELSTSGWRAGWITDTWTLGSELLAEIELTNPWSLTVVVSEPTEGFAFLLLDESTLSGYYTPVPLPGSVLLLSSGLLGLLAMRRRKKQ